MNVKAKLRYVLLVLLLLTSFPPAIGQAAPVNQSGAPPLRLKAGDFIVDSSSIAAAGIAPGQRGYYVVQFHGPVEQAWKDAVTATGAELLAYLPDFAFKVRMTPAQAAQVAQLANVAAVGVFQPVYKTGPMLRSNGAQLYRVRVEQGAAMDAATAAIAQSGATVVRSQDNVLLVAANGGQVNAMAQVLDVAWIENFNFFQKHNEYGGGVIMGANTTIANGYNGSSQIAAVADTGLGDGTAAGAHPYIPAGRIVNIYSWSASNAQFCYRVRGNGAQDVDSGHGTHVAGSVLGGGAPNGEGRSPAPAARLVFQAVEEYLDIYGVCTDPTTPDDYYLIGIPDDLHQLFQQAYNAGARIHANSWGSNAAGDYTLDSANADDFIFDNPDMVITFSAGNEGIDANSNGVVDNDSIGSPATAKNVITIGASENDRQGNYQCDINLPYISHDLYQPNQTCNSMGGQNVLGTYGSRWPADYPAEPLFSDPTAGNKEQLASFSSRGPTDDGRIKPDVVAPGTWVLSGYSPLYQEGYGDPLNAQNNNYQSDGWGMPKNVQHKYFGGTSMSNPLAASAATVVRDYYQKAHNHNASAALTKATLINSAIDLLDENNDGANDNDFPIPNMHEGWGRVNLVNATDGSLQFVDNTAGVSTGGSSSYQYNVQTAGAPFKVSLVWSDFASTEAAATNLVNNLDLVVTAPNGAIYRGNNFSGGWSQTNGAADSVNNVENVYVQSAQTGVWTVVVQGANVPLGPQRFALVVDGNLATANTPPSATLVNPAEGSTVAGNVTIAINATDAQDPAGTLTVQWNLDGGAWQPTSYNSSTGRYEAAWNSTAVSDGNHTINARATDSGNSTSVVDSNLVNVDNVPNVTMHIGDLEATTTLGSAGRWNATITIRVHDNSEGAVNNATVTGNWSAGASGTNSCTTDVVGQCQFTKSNISKNSPRATFTVTSVTHATNTYQASVNHDVDGDSSGTAITVNKPAIATSVALGDEEEGVEEPNAEAAFTLFIPVFRR